MLFMNSEPFTAEAFTAIVSRFGLTAADFDFYNDDAAIEALVFRYSPAVVISLKEMSKKWAKTGGVAMSPIFDHAGNAAGIAQYFSGWPNHTDNGWVFISLIHPNCRAIAVELMQLLMQAFATDEIKYEAVADAPGSN